MNVGQRHFRRRDQKQIPLAADLEQVGFEFRQLAGGFERRAVHEVRRNDLQVSVLARVQVEHEVGQRSRQPRARAEQQRRISRRTSSWRARNQEFRVRVQIPVRERFEIECLRLAPGPHDDVVGFALTNGHRRVRKIGQRHQNDRPLLLDLIELDADLPNLLRPLPVGVEDAARVFALPLRSRHLIARRVLLPLQPFELGNQPAPAVLEHRQLLELAVDVHPAALEPAFHVVPMIAYVSRVKHGEIVCDSRIAA